MLQRLSIAHTQVKAGNNSEHCLYQSKEITKEVYKDIIKSIQI